jgi:YHS domain-containing protein
MKMTDHVSLAERYRAAYYRGDFEALRALLADDFVFAGPTATYHGVDDFQKASDHVRIVKSVETEIVFCGSNEVCAILTLLVDHKVRRFPLVEWYRFDGDRIASIQTIFDTGPFVRTSIEDADTAIDPVCHMSVNKNAPVATREHGGRTYYFCSEGCGIAFHEDPHRYLVAE